MEQQITIRLLADLKEHLQQEANKFNLLNFKEITYKDRKGRSTLNGISRNC